MFDILLRSGSEQIRSLREYSMIRRHHFWHLEVRTNSDDDAVDVSASTVSPESPGGLDIE